MNALSPTGESLSTENVIVRRIAIAAGALGAVAALGALWLGGPRAALGSLIGTALGTVNFWALARLVIQLIDSKADKGSKGPAAVLYIAKAVGFFILAGFLVSRPWMHREGFMAGFTAVVFAIAIGGLWGASDDTPTDGGNQ